MLRTCIIKDGLYIIQILCRRHPFSSYTAGLTIAEPSGEAEVSPSVLTPLSPSVFTPHQIIFSPSLNGRYVTLRFLIILGQYEFIVLDMDSLAAVSRPGLLETELKWFVFETYCYAFGGRIRRFEDVKVSFEHTPLQLRF